MQFCHASGEPSVDVVHPNGRFLLEYERVGTYHWDGLHRRWVLLRHGRVPQSFRNSAKMKRSRAGDDPRYPKLCSSPKTKKVVVVWVCSLKKKIFGLNPKSRPPTWLKTTGAPNYMNFKPEGVKAKIRVFFMKCSGTNSPFREISRHSWKTYFFLIFLEDPILALTPLK